MLIKDLASTVDSVNAAVATQKAYVESLADKFTAGQTTIRVFSEMPNVWTLVSLQAFWQLQQDKLLEMMTYQGTLNSAQTAIQSQLDTLLVGVVVPPLGAGV